jgi:antirestriction protein ArdC
MFICNCRRARAGARGATIYFFKRLELPAAGETDAEPPPDEDGRPLGRTVPPLRRHTVFHASQIEGLPSLEEAYGPAGALPDHAWEAEDRLEDLLHRTGARIVHGGDRAYYDPVEDCIALPPRQRFPSAAAFFGVAFHELGHWTGHETRLNRPFARRRDAPEYAREELRAELASAFLGAELGIRHDLDSHATYLDRYLGLLRGDPREIFRASRDAQAIADLILDRHPIWQLKDGVCARRTEPPPAVSAEAAVSAAYSTQIGQPFHGKLDACSTAKWTVGAKRRGGRKCLLLDGFLRQWGLEFAQGFPDQGERMGVMDQAVEDGVGQGGMAQGLVPVRHRQLTGDHGRAGLIAVIEQVQQVAPPFVVEQSQAPVVEDEHLDLGEGGHEFEVAPVDPGAGQFVEQARQALIQGGVAVPAGGIGQGARQIGFAHAARTGDEYVLMGADPIAGEQPPHCGAVQAARVAVVDVLGHGGLLEAGLPQSVANLPVLPLGDLAVDPQAQALLEGQGLEVRGPGLFGQGLDHPEQTQVGQPLVGGMIEQGRASQWK